MFKYFASAIAMAAMLASAPAPVLAQAGVPYDEYPELSDVCATLLNPGPNSGFETIAIDVDKQLVSSTSDRVLLGIVGVGTPTQTYGSFYGAHVNGSQSSSKGKGASVNIHAYANVTNVYPDGATATYQVTTTNTYIYNYNCHTHKPTSGNDQEEALHPGYKIAPAGQQKPGQVSEPFTEIVVTTETVHIPGPWTDPNSTGGTAEMVICNSPGRNPGVWRAQNGYDGSLGTCSTAFYLSLGGDSPSVSVP